VGFFRGVSVRVEGSHNPFIGFIIESCRSSETDIRFILLVVIVI